MYIHAYVLDLKKDNSIILIMCYVFVFFVLLLKQFYVNYFRCNLNWQNKFWKEKKKEFVDGRFSSTEMVEWSYVLVIWLTRDNPAHIYILYYRNIGKNNLKSQIG